jgi:MFS family permease
MPSQNQRLAIGDHERRRERGCEHEDFARDSRADAGAGKRWLILAVLFLARTAMGFQFQSVGALSSFLVAELGIDYAQLGLLIGFYLLPGIAIAYPGGLLGRRFGDKRIALLGLALMVLGGVMASLSGDYGTLLIARLVSGIGAVLLNVLLTKMATDWFVGREIGTALAILVSSWPIGIGLALVGLPWSAGAFSVPVAFGATAVAAALALILVGTAYQVPAKSSAPPPSVSATRIGLSAREFGLVSLAGGIWSLYNVGYIILVSFTPSLLIARGMSTGEAGFAVSLIAWTIVITIPLGGMLLDRIGHASALMTASFAAFGLGTMLMPIAPSLAWIVVLGGVAGVPAGAIMALPAEVLRPESRGPGMGVFLTWYYVGMALLTPAAGLARDLTADPGAPLMLAGSLEITAIAVLGLFRVFQHRSRLLPS